MKVCIIGAGVVGSFLAKKLSKEGYEIAVVDVDSSKLEQLALTADVMTLNCDALNANCLKQLKEFELFVVVTENDEKNIAITILLKGLFKKERVLFRVSNKAFSSPPVKEFLKAKPVNILSETVQKVMLAIKYPFSKEVIRVEGEKLLIFKIQIDVNSLLAGKQIVELSNLRKELPFTIVAIEREGKVIIPRGENFIFSGDIVYIAVKEEEALKLPEVLGIKYDPVRLVFVLGYSNFTEELLVKLSELKEVKVKFISANREKCEEMSGKFPNIDVFFGELTDKELLKEEGIEKADLSISLTEDEEVNILSAILSKKLGAKRVCSLITHPEYEEIVASIGIDLPIAPRKVLATKVYRELSKAKYLEIVELSQDIEIVETEVEKEVQVKDFNSCGLIVAVRKGEKTEIATGSTVLKPGDKLICVIKREK
ncbi:NAD-binding protein [Thermovibrio sp.]